MAKILLLNPPGDKIYIRSNYCSKISKTRFVHEPVDLLMLSGIIAENFEIKILDAIAECMNFEDTYKYIKSFNPKAIITLVGSASWKNDTNFLSQLRKNKPDIIIAVSGDEVMESPAFQLSQINFLDAIITDYTSSDIISYLKWIVEGKNFPGELSGLVYKKDKEIIKERDKENIVKIFSIPISRHEMFPLDKYKYPFTRRKPFVQMMTDYGCPYHCAFCIFGYGIYKIRDNENVLNEMRKLKQNGIKEIIFGDQTFGVNRVRINELCNRMIDEKFNFTWSCYSRVDIVDEDLLKLFKKAGCHTIIFGVESGSDNILKRYNKGFNIAQIKETFARAKKIGIKRAATFIIGLPGETEEDCNQTISLAIELDADYASFNTAVPRKRTKLRSEAIAKHYIDDNLEEMDQSGTYIVLESENLSREKILELHRKAVKTFYLRPSYIFNRLLKIHSWHETCNLFAEGFNLLSGIRLKKAGVEKCKLF